MSDRFVKINHTFKSRSDARQSLQEWKKNGKIIDYIISWDTQLRMKIQVIYP